MFAHLTAHRHRENDKQLTLLFFCTARFHCSAKFCDGHELLRIFLSLPQHVAETVVYFKTKLYNCVKDPKVHPNLKAEVNYFPQNISHNIVKCDCTAHVRLYSSCATVQRMCGVQGEFNLISLSKNNRMQLNRQVCHVVECSNGACVGYRLFVFSPVKGVLR